MSTHVRKWTLAVAAAMCLAAVTPGSAQAQGEQVDGAIKGTIGLGLLGGEVGLVLAPAVGLTDAWAMAVFPLVGAAGGAVGGYFAFDSGGAGEPAVPVALFVGGVALVIPSVVLALTLSADTGEDEGPVAMTPERRKRLARRRAGSGLVRVTPHEAFVAAPGLAVDRQGAQVSLVSGAF